MTLRSTCMLMLYLLITHWKTGVHNVGGLITADRPNDINTATHILMILLIIRNAAATARGFLANK
ncbi:hypothetical protein SLIQ_16135 [Serratia liquefaciens FK01]|nr:hypothetical protein SLIQ_16135 [Serratia liquefaciens FK01]